MYDKDYFMLPNSPNGRTNVGTVSLEANELKLGADGTLTLVLSHAEPTDADTKSNWLPAPEGQFALIIRAYVPGKRSAMTTTHSQTSNGSRTAIDRSNVRSLAPSRRPVV